MGLEPPTPEASAPATAGQGAPAPAAAGDLPDFAKKADDLEAIKKAVDDVASVGGGLWLSYLFVLFYLAVAAGAVTHEDLFFERPVKLPFLSIELPLLAFFFLAPILFIIVHAYTLVHLVFLTEKAKRYHQALYDPTRDVDSAARQNLQWQLPSNIFIQFLAGPSSLRRGLFGWLLRAIAWVTLVIAPILLLLMMQVQFVPFHSSFITWTQRLALVVDLALIWWLWGKILAGREVDGRARGSLAWSGLGLAFSLAAILFSGAAATFPGEWQEDHLPAWRFLPALSELRDNDANGNPRTFQDWVVNAKRLSLHDWLFNEISDWVTHRRLPFSSTLVLTGLNIYEGLGIDDPEKAKWRDYVFRARGRDLRGAIFDIANLPKVDFEGADLQGASLGGAQLQGASLVGAQLQGASLDHAQLQGALLDGAQLQGASLDDAQLQGVLLWRAQLQGASLDDATLQATDLSGAYLWRTRGDPKSIANVLLLDDPDTWRPVWRDENDGVQPWDAKANRDLQKTIEALPPGGARDQALARIRALDCADKALASCDPASPPAPATWSRGVHAHDARYSAALAAELRTLACSGGGDTIYVVRGSGIESGFQSRLKAAGAAASGLVDDLMNKDSKDCPLAAALTDADRAKLEKIKVEIQGR